MMGDNNYKWHLMKGSRKYPCPACGKKRFVPFVDDGGNLAGAEFGRCDREQSCGYFRYPSQIAPMISPKPATPPEAEIPFVYRPEVLRPDKGSVLQLYALRHFNNRQVAEAWDNYKVGSHYTSVIFWQIDYNDVIRGGKVMKYTADGHRDKTIPVPCFWTHKIKGFAGLFTGNTLHQCLFGEHLLKTRPNAPVMVVESEKTALLMSIIKPKYLWLACGGSQMLKKDERLAVLNGRDVTFVPDHGMWCLWSDIARKHGWNCSDYIELHPKFAGCDILDYYL